MSNNGAYWIMLFFVISIFMTSCDGIRRTVAKLDGSNTTTTHTTRTKKVSKTVALRQDVTRYSRDYIGTDYKYAGKTPKGFDCSGFTSYVMNNFDITLSPSSRTQATQGRKIPVSKVKPGDLVFFGKRGQVTHVAMVVANTRSGIEVIHSTTSNGVMVQNISTSAYWKPKIMFARDVIQ